MNKEEIIKQFEEWTKTNTNGNTLILDAFPQLSMSMFANKADYLKAVKEQEHVEQVPVAFSNFAGKLYWNVAHYPTKNTLLYAYQPKAIEPYAWYIGALNAFTTNRDEMLKMSKNYPVTPLYK